MIVPLLFWLTGQKRWRELPDYRILQEEIKCSGRDLNPGSSPWEGEMLNRTTPPELRHNEFDLHIKLMSSYVLCATHISQRLEVLKFFKLFVNSYLQYLSITVSINFYSIASYTWLPYWLYKQQFSISSGNNRMQSNESWYVAWLLRIRYCYF